MPGDLLARTALALFLFFQGLFALTASGWVFRLPDELEVYLQTESLVDRGSLAIPQVREPGLAGSFFGRRGPDPAESALPPGERRGLEWAPYGPALAFVALPHHLAARGVAAVLGIDRARTPLAWRTVVAGLTALAASTAGALAVALCFAAACQLSGDTRRSAALALALGGATVLWPYATSFFSEAFSAATLLGVVVLLLEARRLHAARRRAASLALGAAAVLLALACLLKATTGVYALALALAPLAEGRRRAALTLLLGVVAAGLVHAQWNQHRFGSAFELGYDWSETIPGVRASPGSPPVAVATFGGSLARGLAVQLLAPGKSLLLWAPALVLLSLPRARELRSERALAWGLGGALALGLVVFGVYLFPEGGYCHGPRHLVPIVPLLLLPAALGRAPTRRSLVLALLLGLPLNLAAVATSYKEDQALGEDRAHRLYYELDASPPAGRPENVYRLRYLPQVTLPARALASLGRLARGEAEPPGTGLDLLPLHLARARAVFPPAERDALARSLGLLLPLVSLVLLALGARELKRALPPAPRPAAEDPPGPEEVRLEP